MSTTFFCPNCQEEFVWLHTHTGRFPICPACKLVTRKRPPRRRQVREEILITHRGAAMLLHYESTVHAAKIEHRDDAFFELIAALMNAHPLTELNGFANTPQHGKP